MKRLLIFLLIILATPALVFPFTLNTSTFTGSENPLSEGGNWVTVGDVYPAMKKVSGEARAGTSISDNLMAFNTAPGNDQCSEVTLSAYTASSGNAVSLLVRVSPRDSVANYFKGYWLAFNDGSYYQFEDPGNGVVVANDSGSLTIANGDVLKFCAIGTTLSYYQNGTQFDSVVDASIASGKVGFGVAYNPTEAQVAVGDWRGGDSSDFTVAPVFKRSTMSLMGI